MSNVPLSLFGDDGVDVGKTSRNITYLYGLSDFFSYLFEDTETLNIMLEANAISASEIYSRFLQLTSSLSLENIQTFTGTSIKLVLIKVTDQEDPSIPRYTINLPIEQVKLLTNRPFLPTEVLEADVDFKITRKDINSSYIHFAQPLFNTPAPYKFSSRVNSDGVKEYAIWMTDVLIDEQLMSKHFGELISIDPEISSEAFTNFIYGLYYIYLNGPTLGLLKRGLNLIIGAPLARANETVLDIRGYLATDQFLVITDQNQYLLPFGLLPSVEIGDEIVLGQLLAEWVELKDYTQDGEWWINVSIPRSLIPAIPPGQMGRFATAGSTYDQLMRDYLYKNTFLVKVNVGNFKNTQQFAQIAEIINRAKPTHTQPIYIWSVPNEDYELHLVESSTAIHARSSTVDHFGPPMDIFHRNNLLSPVSRGGSYFLRNCVPTYVSELIGEEPLLGQNQRNYYNGSGTLVQVSGFRAYKAALANLQTYERAWVQATSAFGNFMWRQQANQYSALGNVTVTIPEGTPSYRNFSDIIPPNKRVVALYTTFLSDIITKMTSVGLSTTAATSNNRYFTIGGSSGYLLTNYALFFNKTHDLGSLGAEYPTYSYLEYQPSPAEIGPSDTIYCFKISPTVVGVYWVSFNTTLLKPSCIPVHSIDPLNVNYTMPFNRSSATGGQPLYLTRGGALPSAGATTGSYTDDINPTPVAINRSMGATNWPSSGTLTTLNHRTRA